MNAKVSVMGLIREHTVPAGWGHKVLRNKDGSTRTLRFRTASKVRSDRSTRKYFSHEVAVIQQVSNVDGRAGQYLVVGEDEVWGSDRIV
jgi:hypothetical protein